MACCSSKEPFSELADNVGEPHHQADDVGLLDGGVTNPLRMSTAEELELARPTTVQLAAGTCDLWLSSTRVLLSAQPVLTIVPVPLGTMSRELRCSIQWDDGLCRVRHPMRRQLPIRMMNECPYVDKQLALDLIGELETARAQKAIGAARVSLHKRCQNVSVDDAWTNLKRVVKEPVDGSNVEPWVEGVDQAVFDDGLYVSRCSRGSGSRRCRSHRLRGIIHTSLEQKASPLSGTFSWNLAAPVFG